MPAQIRSNTLDRPASKPIRSHRRPAWRQSLVDVERGFATGLRGDGAIFVHFFSTSIVIAAGLVLGVSLLEWTAIILALTLVLSAEMFRQVLKALLQNASREFNDSARTALRMASAAVCVTMLGSTLAVGLIFTKAILAIFSTE